MKLGAITNGISQDLEEALVVMRRDGIGWAELQFIYDTEICHHTDEQNHRMKTLLDQYGITVAAIMKHVFNGLSVMDTRPDSEAYAEQLRILKRSIGLARFFDCDLTRRQLFAKHNVVFGSGGADKYLASDNRAWAKLLKVMEPVCAIAQDEGIEMMMETGTGAFIHTVALAKRLIDDLRCPFLKILWDPANCLYSMENPLRAYDSAKEHIVDIHIKDIRVDKPLARVVYCALGHGEMSPYLDDIAKALRRDNYDRVVTFENQVVPEGGTEKEGWDLSVGMFTEIFA